MNFPFGPSSSWLEEQCACWWWKNISSVIYFLLCGSECSTQAFIWTLPAVKTPMSNFILALTESSANLWKCAMSCPTRSPIQKFIGNLSFLSSPWRLFLLTKNFDQSIMQTQWEACTWTLLMILLNIALDSSVMARIYDRHLHMWEFNSLLGHARCFSGMGKCFLQFGWL